MATPYAKISQHGRERIFIEPEQAEHRIYKRITHFQAPSKLLQLPRQRPASLRYAAQGKL